MENINTFTGGMNKDISKSLFKEGTYVHAENFTLITDVGLSTGSLRNVNGNEQFLELPPCSEVYALTNVVPGTVRVDINSYIGVYPNINTLEELGQAMQADTNLSSSGYGVAYTDTKVVVYCLLIDNILVIPTLAVTAIANVTVTQELVAIPAANIKIIGWVTIRDQIILFTANTSAINQSNQTGQIWKLIYDKYSNNPVLSLIYNGYLNFSLATPIANPGAAVGNYETPNIQKIYWTDNYNSPKVLNIADANAMAFNPELLDVVSNVSKGVSTIYDVRGGGNIKTGIYQVSGRLSVTSGNSSTFLTPSNIVTVINELETADYGRYEARDTGVNVAKTVVGRLYNLDTKYDRVEPVILYRETPEATPDIYIFPSQPINNNGQLEFQYTGNEVTIPLSLEEFIAEGLVFDTVKTLAAKNNILFFGNVKYSDFDVDFDARAYRFSGTLVDPAIINPRTSKIKNGSNTVTHTFNGATISSLPTTDWGVPKNADAIQDLNDQAPDSTNNFLFQSDGITFGGEGPWVKYEFVPMYTMNDVTVNSQFRTVLDDTKDYTSVRQAPYAKVNAKTKTVNYNLDTPQETGYTQVFQDTLSYDNGSGPFGSYTARGYQRDEMYRFGIVFYSKKGQPSYVHWIGDIRMPKPFMPSNFFNTAYNRDTLYFPISSVDLSSNGFGTQIGNNQSNEVTNNINSRYNINSDGKVLYGNNLGIKFTVTLPPNVQNQISGYSIVRVPRSDQDKTILGQGLFNPMFYVPTGYTSGDKHWTTSNLSTWASQNSTNQGGGVMSSGYFRNTMGTIASPDFLFKNAPSYALYDEVDIVQSNICLGTLGMLDTTGITVQGNVYKFYLPASIKSMAPKAAAVRSSVPGDVRDYNQKTPIRLTETFNLNKGQYRVSAQALKSYGYSGGEISNFGWEGSNANNTITPTGLFTRGVGGSRVFNGFGGDPGNNPVPGLPYRIEALHSIAKGIGNTYPAYSFLLGQAQPWSALLYQDGIYNAATSGLATTPGGNIYLANYRRPVTVQYGGNTYSERSYNEYITTGHSQIVNVRNATSNMTHTSMVFGGDTYITLFDYGEQLRNINVAWYGTANSTQGKYNDTRNIVFLVPVECSFPVEWRKNNSLPAGAVDDGYTVIARSAPNKSIVYGDLVQSTGASGVNAAAPFTTAEWTENFEVNTAYVAENDSVKYFPLPDPQTEQNVFDVRIHRSQIKTNGELTDSWGVFKPEDYLDLDTIQGPLNNLIIYQNAMLGFQDKGVSLVSVKERSLTQDSSGSEIILGSGGILERYDYISRIIGSRHQFSFTTSHDAVFWFDMNTKNAYKLQGQAPISITVAKGMSSYMSNNLKGLIQINDNPYLNKGITATYDFRYNEAIMTFRDSVVDTTKSIITKGFIGAVNNVYSFTVLQTPAWAIPGTTVLVYVKDTGNEYPGTIVSGAGVSVLIPEAPIITSSNTVIIYPYTKNAFTVAYNDIIDAYTSFYSFTPPVYINDYVSIFTPDATYNTFYRHDVGNHSTFYGTIYPSKVTLLINQSPTETKVFDNYEIVCESLDVNGVHSSTNFFKNIRLYNDYQNTDFQTLPIDGSKVIAKRKERTWNLSNLRNRVLYTTPGVDPDIFSQGELSTYTLYSPQTVLGDKVFGERLRDKYLLVDLEYDNLNNYNFIFHTFKSNFRKSAR